MLQFDRAYHWKVRAFDQTGYACWSTPDGGWSFFLRRDEGTPVAGAMAAEAAEGGVLITWSLPADLRVDGARVYRRTEGSEWTCISPTLATQDGGLSFLDSEAEPGTTYEYEVELIGPSGPFARLGPVSFELGAVPDLWLRAGPNPGSSALRISFGLPRAGDVGMRVFNAAGREVARKAWPGLKAGTYEREWRVRLAFGGALPSGTYWVRLDTPAGTRTIRYTVVP